MKRPFLAVASMVLVGQLTVSLLTGCGGDSTAATAGAVTTDTTAAAPTTTLSAGDTGVVLPDAVYTDFKNLGKGQLDVEAWKATEAAQKTVEHKRNPFLYRNEMDPAVIAYWDALGIKKEMHDADEPALKWASYTPLAALADGNTAVYPVVFDFVGAEKLIFYAETHGIAYRGGHRGLHHHLPLQSRSHEGYRPRRHGRLRGSHRRGPGRQDPGRS